MILFFADPHLGHKMYHTLTDGNITTAELDSRIALEKIYERAIRPDIDLIICAGDFFHSPKPSSENIRWVIEWLEKMDKLGKRFIILPGNHDVGALSSSLAFMYSLSLKNIGIIEWEAQSLKWNDWNLHFIPFLTATSLKNKYTDTLQLFMEVAGKTYGSDNNMFITHLQESKATLGAERLMFAKAVEVIDLENFKRPDKGNTLFLSGHMHSHQIYQKNCGVTVCYPGSTTYMESLDCGQPKGYVLINTDGSIIFEPIRGIRVFKKYTLPKGADVIEFFNSARMLVNEVVFLSVFAADVVSDALVRQFLKEQGSVLGKINYVSEKLKNDGTAVSIPVVENNPLLYLENYLSQYKYKTDDFDWKNKILPLGKELLNATAKD